MSQKYNNLIKFIMASENKSNNGLKVAIGILAVLLIGAGALFFLKNNELNEMQADLNSQITEKLSKIDSLNNDIRVRVSQHEELQGEFAAKEDELSNVVEELEKRNATIDDLKKIERKYWSVLAKNKKLNEKIGELEAANTVLKDSIGTIAVQLDEEAKKADSLATQMIEKNKLLESASEVKIAGLKTVAIVERSSGRQIITEKARKADKIKICYSVSENSLAETGDRSYYIQVLDANNNVLGDAANEKFDSRILTYSVKSTFNYNNKSLDICEYVAEPKDGFEKGNYFVNVFKGDKLIAHEAITLK